MNLSVLKKIVAQKWILVILLGCLLILPTAARGQSDLKLAALQIDLWPEYDRPDALVIYSFSLTADTTLPASVTFRIPAAAQLNGYGYYAEDGGRPVQDGYTQRVEGDWLYATFIMRSLRGTLEYYDASLVTDGTKRSFTYQWPADYAAADLQIIVQQPLDATDLSLSASADQPQVGSDGLMYYRVGAGALNAGQTYRLDLTYQKSSTRLSAENMQVQPVSPLPENNSWQALPWILGILGAGLIVGGIGWYWMVSRRTDSHQSRKRRRPAKDAAAKDAATKDVAAKDAAANEAVYCHQCGRRATAGDRFCRSCGSQLRIE